MICSNCKMRWADFPPDWPDVGLSYDEEAERAKIFQSDEIRSCPMCIEELNSQLDYQKQQVRDMYSS